MKIFLDRIDIQLFDIRILKINCLATFEVINEFLSTQNRGF